MKIVLQIFSNRRIIINILIKLNGTSSILYWLRNALDFTQGLGFLMNERYIFPELI